MTTRGRRRLLAVLLTWLGIPLAAFVSYAGFAAWSLRNAEARAGEACDMAEVGASAEAYLARLAEAGFEAQVSHDGAGHIDLIAVSARSMALSRFVCLAPVAGGVVGQADVRYVD